MNKASPMGKCRRLLCHAILFLLLSPGPAQARVRPRITDAEVVEGAELIVVAHVKAGSIVYVPHTPRHNDDGISWEHHAVLVVTEVLKGHAADSEIPIIIHDGLSPVVGDNRQRGLFASDAAYPQGVIEIFDTGNSIVGLPSISGDIRQDQLWFLRVQSTKDEEYRGADSTDALGIWDPENVQRSELRPFYQALLTEHPENKLKESAVGNSPLAVRSRQCLAHLRMAEALQEPDLAERAELLLPFYLFTEKDHYDPTHREATIHMRFGCGTAGAARLVAVFNDPRYKVMQGDIMVVWDESGYRESISIVTDFLRTQNQLRASQDIGTVLSLLRRFADPQAKPVIEETRQLRKRQDVEDGSGIILRECDKALSAIDHPPASE